MSWWNLFVFTVTGLCPPLLHRLCLSFLSKLPYVRRQQQAGALGLQQGARAAPHFNEHHIYTILKSTNTLVNLLYGIIRMSDTCHLVARDCVGLAFTGFPVFPLPFSSMSPTLKQACLLLISFAKNVPLAWHHHHHSMDSEHLYRAQKGTKWEAACASVHTHMWLHLSFF